ncbi:hypothetical protein GCM10023224_49410 [Streptomonospora halophila]|uniref:Uncharacterized protein n=1 Tax=Streptomonospora halophila TaxID=427369 RepID=A0ABP9H2L9_9ACTN
MREHIRQGQAGCCAFIMVRLWRLPVTVLMSSRTRIPRMAERGHQGIREHGRARCRAGADDAAGRGPGAVEERAAIGTALLLP